MCIFCKIASGEIPCFKLYEDELVLAYLDINPFSTGHTLVIPKRHCEGMQDADPDLLAQMILRVRKVAVHIKEVLPCDGFNILQNNGAAAGQTVNHMHFHIVPRLAADAMQDITFTNHTGDMTALAALAKRLALPNL